MSADLFCATHPSYRYVAEREACSAWWPADDDCRAAVLVPVDQVEAERVLVGFLDEFLAVGGNGEGWTAQHFQAALDLLMRRPVPTGLQEELWLIVGDRNVDVLAALAVQP